MCLEARCQDNGARTHPTRPPLPTWIRTRTELPPPPEASDQTGNSSDTRPNCACPGEASNAAGPGFPQAHRLSIPTSTHCTSFRSGADTSGGFSFSLCQIPRGGTGQPLVPTKLFHHLLNSGCCTQYPGISAWWRGFSLFLSSMVSFPSRKRSCDAFTEAGSPSFLTRPLRAPPFT